MTRLRTSARTFVAPMTYVQGPGVIEDLGAIVGGRHRRVVVLVDEFVHARLGPRVAAALRDAGRETTLHAVAGEVTAARIAGLADRVRAADPTVVVAVGGGKTLDTGKGVARELGIGIVTVPTIASNDGPTSRVIATYDDAHRLVATPTMPVGPEAVVVDTEIIAAAPVEFLLSGIGDAMAKDFEAAACLRGTGPTSNGGRPLLLPTAVAGLCRRVLESDAASAVASVRAGRPDEALERVVEAVVLMSGLAFENGGLSLAHSMTRGLMQVAGMSLHGYHVAYGLLVQLVHEDRTADFATTREFFARLGLPVRLADLDAPADDAARALVIDATLGAPHMGNCSPTPDRASLARAIGSVETAG